MYENLLKEFEIINKKIYGEWSRLERIFLGSWVVTYFLFFISFMSKKVGWFLVSSTLFMLVNIFFVIYIISINKKSKNKEQENAEQENIKTSQRERFLKKHFENKAERRIEVLHLLNREYISFNDEKHIKLLIKKAEEFEKNYSNIFVSYICKFALMVILPIASFVLSLFKFLLEDKTKEYIDKHWDFDSFIEKLKCVNVSVYLILVGIIITELFVIGWFLYKKTKEILNSKKKLSREFREDLEIILIQKENKNATN